MEKIQMTADPAAASGEEKRTERRKENAWVSSLQWIRDGSESVSASSLFRVSFVSLCDSNAMTRVHAFPEAVVVAVMQSHVKQIRRSGWFWDFDPLVLPAVVMQSNFQVVSSPYSFTLSRYTCYFVSLFFSVCMLWVICCYMIRCALCCYYCCKLLFCRSCFCSCSPDWNIRLFQKERDWFKDVPCGIVWCYLDETLHDSELIVCAQIWVEISMATVRSSCN
jgi:hypothetical protein